MTPQHVTSRLGPRRIHELTDGSLYVELTTEIEVPQAIAATLITGTSFQANWNLPSGVLSFQLDVSTSPIFSSFVAGYNNLSVSANFKSVTGLIGVTNYYYRVRAVYSTGTSISSNTMPVTTLRSVDLRGYEFGGLAGQNLVANATKLLNNMQKCSVIAWIKHEKKIGFDQSIFSLWFDTAIDNRDQWLSAVLNSDKLFWGGWNASARAFATGGTVMADGGVYKCGWVFDGSQAGNAARLKMYLARLVGGVYAATVPQTNAYAGAAIPANLSVVGGIGLNVTIGNTLASNISPFNGTELAIRVFHNRALSQAEFDAQDVLSDLIGASWRWDLDGSGANTGLVSGFDASPNGVVDVTVTE